MSEKQIDHGERNIHHIIPRSRHGSGHEINTVQVDVEWHDQLHKVFRNGVLHEKIRELICWTDNEASSLAKRQLMRLLLSAVKEGELYLPEALRKPLNNSLRPPRGNEKEKAERLFASSKLVNRIYALLEWDLPVVRESVLDEILVLLEKQF
jgi:hypothetical protein